MADEPRRYVVLRHEGIPEPHFDLMFELEPGRPLATWRSTEWPLKTYPRLERLNDHRREYLGYEGPVSNDRGFVRCVERGTFEMEPGFSLPILALRLHGHRDRVLFLRRVSETGWLPWLRAGA